MVHREIIVDYYVEVAVIVERIEDGDGAAHEGQGVKVQPRNAARLAHAVPGIRPPILVPGHVGVGEIVREEQKVKGPALAGFGANFQRGGADARTGGVQVGKGVPEPLIRPGFVEIADGPARLVEALEYQWISMAVFDESAQQVARLAQLDDYT